MLRCEGGLTFVYRGHRCKGFCYSWQKRKRDCCSKLSKNLPSWNTDERVVAVSCITGPGSLVAKRLAIHIQALTSSPIRGKPQKGGEALSVFKIPPVLCLREARVMSRGDRFTSAIVRHVWGVRSLCKSCSGQSAASLAYSERASERETDSERESVEWRWNRCAARRRRIAVWLLPLEESTQVLYYPRKRETTAMFDTITFF